MGKPTMWFLKRSVPSQKRARSLKFRIQVEEENIMYYQSSKNKGTDQLCSYSASLFSPMQIVGFPMWRLMYVP